MWLSRHPRRHRRAHLRETATAGQQLALPRPGSPASCRRTQQSRSACRHHAGPGPGEPVPGFSHPGETGRQGAAWTRRRVTRAAEADAPRTGPAAVCLGQGMPSGPRPRSLWWPHPGSGEGVLTGHWECPDTSHSGDSGSPGFRHVPTTRQTFCSAPRTPGERTLGRRRHESSQVWEQLGTPPPHRECGPSRVSGGHLSCVLGSAAGWAELARLCGPGRCWLPRPPMLRLRIGASGGPQARPHQGPGSARALGNERELTTAERQPPLTHVQTDRREQPPACGGASGETDAGMQGGPWVLQWGPCARAGYLASGESPPRSCRGHRPAGCGPNNAGEAAR